MKPCLTHLYNCCWWQCHQMMENWTTNLISTFAKKKTSGPVAWCYTLTLSYTLSGEFKNTMDGELSCKSLRKLSKKLGQDDNPEPTTALIHSFKPFFHLWEKLWFDTPCRLLCEFLLWVLSWEVVQFQFETKRQASDVCKLTLRFYGRTAKKIVQRFEDVILRWPQCDSFHNRHGRGDSAALICGVTKWHFGV